MQRGDDEADHERDDERRRRELARGQAQVDALDGQRNQRRSEQDRFVQVARVARGEDSTNGGAADKGQRAAAMARRGDGGDGCGERRDRGDPQLAIAGARRCPLRRQRQRQRGWDRAARTTSKSARADGTTAPSAQRQEHGGDEPARGGRIASPGRRARRWRRSTSARMATDGARSTRRTAAPRRGRCNRATARRHASALPGARAQIERGAQRDGAEHHRARHRVAPLHHDADAGDDGRGRRRRQLELAQRQPEEHEHGERRQRRQDPDARHAGERRSCRT